LSNAPHYTYNARIDYVAENGFFANLEVVGSDEYYESNSHDEKRSSFAQFNGAVGYRYNNWNPDDLGARTSSTKNMRSASSSLITAKATNATRAQRILSSSARRSTTAGSPRS